MTKLDIKSYNLEQLKNELSQMGEKPFRAGQIYKWLHIDRVSSLLYNIVKRYHITIIGGINMPRRPLENLTESMFYVLLALKTRPMCGMEIAAFLERATNGRLRIGPATLYTVLSKFEEVQYIEEIAVEGRKRTYRITSRGTDAYNAELGRLTACLRDAEAIGGLLHE